jgi:phosphonate transport system substrate-binding protein
MILALCTLASDLFPGSYSETETSVPQDQRKILNVGYSAGAFSRGFLKDAQVVLESLGASVAERATDLFSGVTATIHETFEDFHAAISRNELDLVIMSSLDYLSMEDEGLLEPVCVGRNAHGVLREYIIIVSKDSGLKEVGQLNNRSVFIETGGSGRTPLVWLESYLLQRVNAGLASFFGDVKHVDKASEAVLPVFFHNADACVTTIGGFSTMKELNPQLGQSLEIIGRSNKLLRGMACVNSKLEGKRRRVVIETILNLHRDPDGEQILIVMREEQLVPFRPEYLKTSRELYRLYQAARVNR